MKTTLTEHEQVRAKVREGYGKIAAQGGSCCGPASCCNATGKLAEQIGYSADELAALPDGANLGLSCGNPTAIASLKRGEVVLDLGSGAGFDVLLQLRHQPLPRQTAGLARDRPRAQTGGSRRRVRPRTAQTAAGRHP